MKKILLLLVSAVIFFGCSTTAPTAPPSTGSTEAPTRAPTKAPTAVAQKSLRPLMGEDSFSLDVCSEVTPDFVTQVTGLQIKKTRDFSNSTSTGCSYFMTDSESGQFVMVVVDFMNVEDQKTGLKALGRTLKTDARIKMDHFLTYQENGVLNDIYLIMTPDKFVRVERSGVDVINEDKFIDFAASLVDKILYR
jgi:hypothetical protein